MLHTTRAAQASTCNIYGRVALRGAAVPPVAFVVLLLFLLVLLLLLHALLLLLVLLLRLLQRPGRSFEFCAE